MSAPPTEVYPPGTYAQPPRTRPIGVAILAILVVLIGVFLLIGAIGILVASGALAVAGLALFGLVGAVLAAVLGILGIIWVAVGLGLWKLRGWAWWLAVIVMLITAVATIANPVAAVPPAVILVYLIVVRGRFR
jgi:hypothetical protein